MSRPLPAGFRRTFRRELRRIAHQPRLAFMLGPFPLILMLLLSAVFAPGLPSNLPVAVVDQDGTTLSRQAVRMIDATADLAVTVRATSLAEAQDALVSGAVYAVIFIPQSMGRDLLQGNRPELVTFYNNQFLTVGGIVSRASRQAMGTFSAGVATQALVANGAVPEAAVEAVVPIPVQRSPLFNPALDYVQFLLAALMPTVLQIFITASAALTIGSDVQHPNGMARLTRIGGSSITGIAGKLAPYGLAYLLTLIFADVIIFGAFDAPFNGNIWLHGAYSAGFVLACLCLGGMLAMIAGETVGALGLTGVLTGPAFGFAGISFPRITMNTFAWIWGGLLPLTAYLQLRTDQVLRGAPIEVSLPAFGWLLAQILLYGSVLVFLVARSAQVPAKQASIA
ncbi:ABC transporter permease [Ruegeria sp. HU-ET01832]|uniref:ABC transporter permease n=1 Tax=Ruegeria sp. HU-ET01832 TaxID=3135906 RepID=UPI00333E3A85